MNLILEPLRLLSSLRLTISVQEAETTRQLVHMGYRPVVLGLLAQGADAEEIAQILEDDYDIRTKVGVVRSIIKSMGLTPTQALAISTAKEVEALKMEALTAYTDFKDLYLRGKTRLTFDRDRALEEMQFAADQFGKWWDRIARLYPVAISPTTNTTSIIAVIQQEMSRGLTPDRFENILGVLDAEAKQVPTAASPQAVQGQEAVQGAGHQEAHPEGPQGLQGGQDVSLPHRSEPESDSVGESQ